MSEPVPSSTAWPAARPTGIKPVQHPAWEEARNAIIDLAAKGPVTAVLVGKSGTGKTWLLRELAAALGDHGFPTMILMQGDLPMALSSGAALLVDQASLMSPAMRAQMLAQEYGVVVLASQEWPESELDSDSPNLFVITLRPLEPDEIGDFAAEWLHQSGLPPAVIDDATLARLAARSGGRVGTIVQLLGEAVASWRQPPVVFPKEEPPIKPLPIPSAERPIAPIPAALPRRAAVSRPARRRRGVSGVVLAGSVVAIAIAAGWMLRPVPQPVVIAQQSAPPPVVVALAPTTPAPVPTTQAPTTTPAPALPPVQQAETPNPAQTAIAEASPPAPAAPSPWPPLRDAETSGPALITAPTPSQPGLTAAPLVTPPPPALDAANPPRELDSTAPSPAMIASAPPPPVLGTVDPAIADTLDDPTLTIPPPPKPLPASHVGGPGLVLIAQRGDTLQRLYANVYRDRKAPPFAKVLAANPGPFKPGAIVIFPEPPGGWQRNQR